MKECIKNHSRYARKKDVEDISIQILCTEMEKEVYSVGGKPMSLQKLKVLLEKTRNKKNLERNKKSATYIFTTYPALRIQDLVKYFQTSQNEFIRFICFEQKK